MRTNEPTKQVAASLDAGPLPTSICPACRYEADAASSTNGQVDMPSSGDLTVCLNCGEILQFNDILVAKPIPKDFMMHEDNKATLDLMSALIKRRGRIR